MELNMFAIEKDLGSTLAMWPHSGFRSQLMRFSRQDK